ncbi:MAG: hypothetical protein M1835_003876 [Candelina submexicana]|nr:MAG: hypothetical protein M1835_003876 [Candelina submexicana]
MSSRIVLITGANSGVGFATAKVLANATETFHIIMTGRSLKKVNGAKMDLEAAGIKGSLSTAQLDVTDDESIEQAVKAVRHAHGHLDVLVNNAAVGNRDPDIKTRLQSCLNTNLMGPALVATAFRPLLLEAQKPYSIFVSSGGGSLTRAGMPDSARMSYEEAYRVSKAALNMFAVVEARDYGPKGLKVFPMCPGFVVSNLRGTSDDARTGGGQAGDPMDSGKLILSIIQGERDADVGKFVHKDGIYPW